MCPIVGITYQDDMTQYSNSNQVRSLIKQAYLVNQVLDAYGFTTVLDIGTGPGIIKRVLVKQGKICHTMEQYHQWDEFKKFSPEIDFRMGYYKDRRWELPVLEQRYDCVVLARFFDLYHTEIDFESVVATLHTAYADNILILHNPKAWRLNLHAQKRCKKHMTNLWPIYVLSKTC